MPRNRICRESPSFVGGNVYVSTLPLSFQLNVPTKARRIVPVPNYRSMMDRPDGNNALPSEMDLGPCTTPLVTKGEQRRRR